MNYGKHLTHFQGKPLRDMTREDLIEALQHYSALYTEAKERWLNDKASTGRVDYTIF